MVLSLDADAITGSVGWKMDSFTLPLCPGSLYSSFRVLTSQIFCTRGAVGRIAFGKTKPITIRRNYWNLLFHPVVPGLGCGGTRMDRWNYRTDQPANAPPWRRRSRRRLCSRRRSTSNGANSAQSCAYGPAGFSRSGSLVRRAACPRRAGSCPSRSRAKSPHPEKRKDPSPSPRGPPAANTRRPPDRA